MTRYQCTVCPFGTDAVLYANEHTSVSGHTMRDARVPVRDDRPEWVKRAGAGTLPVKVYR